MRILTSEESAVIDRLTTSELGIPSRVLMESAGRAVAAVVLARYPVARRITVVAGKGNNGGDGLVIARTLLQRGVEVTTLLFSTGEDLGADSRANLDALFALGGDVIKVSSPDSLSSVDTFSVFRVSDVLIDALYGTGFHGELVGAAKEVCRLMNAGREIGRAQTVAVDIPSGVNGTTGQVSSDAVQADITVSFQHPKLGTVILPGALHAGEIVVVDIGLTTEAPADGESSIMFVTPEIVRPLVDRAYQLAPDSHKGERGHVCVVGGSPGKYGAPLLTSRAALRSGAGLCTMVTDDAAPPRAALAEVMVERQILTDSSADWQNFLVPFERLTPGRSAIVVGPGLGTSNAARRAQALALEFAMSNQLGVVVDADGLNNLAADPDLWRFISDHTVLTPHAQEMARLSNKTLDQVRAERVHSARDLSVRRGCWVLLKGARTIISGPLGELFINPHAAPTLATAGSGDVLSGIIGALLARGLSAAEAAVTGAYLHGEAAVHTDGVGVLASEIADAVPKASREILNHEGLPFAFPLIGVVPPITRKAP